MRRYYPPAEFASLFAIATASNRGSSVAADCGGQAMKQNQARPTSSSVEDFCARHAISEATFYRRRAEMPRAIKVGGQLRIVDADEQAWIEVKQDEAAAGREVQP
jgi:hypothetical protein